MYQDIPITPEWLFAQPCEFIFGSQSPADLPAQTLPEVAFVGRSNVGKSSLINFLTNRKSLARTSHTPGRTRQINFFDLGGRLRLVDLPGYGYAKMSRTEHAQWERLMLAYLVGRQALRLVLLLVDARHGLKESDRMMMDLLDEAAVPYRLTLTKHDKIDRKEQDKILAALAAELIQHPAALPDPILTSSVSRYGQDALRATLTALI